MAASLTAVIKEKIRQEATGDDRYYLKKPYAFILHGPRMKGPIGPLGYATFPLPLGPRTLDYTLPFAASLTPVQEQGVVVEEGGIVIAHLTLEATTGFALKQSGSTSAGSSDGEFTGILAKNGLAFQELSGQMHFWHIANRCFDAYSHFKKNSKFAAETHMEFHLIKDQVHLHVVPRNFRMHRSAEETRVTYGMTVEMDVIGEAEPVIAESPDKSMMDRIKDKVSRIRETIQGVRAALDDLTAALDDIRRLVSNITNIITDVGTIADAFDDFVSGAKSFLTIPRQLITNTTTALESVADFLANSATNPVPRDLVQCIRKLEDAMDAFAMDGQSSYLPTYETQIRRYNAKVMGYPEGADSELDALRAEAAATGEAADGKLKIQDVFEASVKPGDARRAGLRTPDQRLIAEMAQSFVEIVVGSGDSLPSIAAKRLQDPNRWPELALINRLQAPFITEGPKLPNTLQPGSKILIPAVTPSEGSADTFTTGEPVTGQIQMEYQLGEDFELYHLGNGTYGWRVNVAAGSTDVYRVRGVKNMVQAVGSRLRTEQGTNILYPSYGPPRMVGVSAFLETQIGAQVQVKRQLLADARVEGLPRFSLRIEEDRAELDADLQIAGFSSTRPISQTLK